MVLDQNLGTHIEWRDNAWHTGSYPTWTWNILNDQWPPTESATTPGSINVFQWDAKSQTIGSSRLKWIPSCLGMEAIILKALMKTFYHHRQFFPHYFFIGFTWYVCSFVRHQVLIVWRLFSFATTWSCFAQFPMSSIVPRKESCPDVGFDVVVHRSKAKHTGGIQFLRSVEGRTPRWLIQSWILCSSGQHLGQTHEEHFLSLIIPSANFSFFFSDFANVPVPSCFSSLQETTHPRLPTYVVGEIVAQGSLIAIWLRGSSQTPFLRQLGKKKNIETLSTVSYSTYLSNVNIQRICMHVNTRITHLELTKRVVADAVSPSVGKKTKYWDAVYCVVLYLPVESQYNYIGQAPEDMHACQPRLIKSARCLTDNFKKNPSSR